MATAFLSHWALAPAFFCSSPSWPASFHTGCLQQFGQFLARVKQARLHGVFRNADDLSHLFHGFLVVVDEIDDLPMFRRKRGQALPQRVTGILLLYRHFRIVGRILDRIGGFIIQFNVLPAPQRRQGLESRNHRPSNLPARRHTSRKTSLMRSSATCSFRTRRSPKRNTLTWCRPY